MFRGIYHLIEALEGIYSRIVQNVKIAKPTFSTRRDGHLAALTRSHLIGEHPSGLTKEQTTETMDPSPKTKWLRHYPRQ